ncbi:cell wall hydrolase [uncultured Sphingomonas sp.]|uniref:cell wall hydrolase n=1 Tax=uncultured Sphingomonas sp. TaxID=158754 RepID=UPI0035CC8067
MLSRSVIPVVEPLHFEKVAPASARTINAGVPFASGRPSPAQPFRFTGADADRARATDCLAAAAYYEAGSDPMGQRAVVQVVLNRVRHPAFPKSICAVVFEGSQRTTGCQFTFTCRGALIRYRPTPSAWGGARAIAAAALSGAVDETVGIATHYHTDWVVPAWSASMDKIAKVNTHLFFRWTGWWGGAAALNQPSDIKEPVVAALAGLSPAHAGIGEDALAGAGLTVTAGGHRPVLSTASDPDMFLVELLPGGESGYARRAGALCGTREICRVLGWTDRRRVARALPLSPDQLASLAFSYARDRGTGLERSQWDCERVVRPDPSECLHGGAPRLPGS